MRQDTISIHISENSFEETLGRKPKNDKEWENFVHLFRKGIEAQIDTNTVKECIRMEMVIE